MVKPRRGGQVGQRRVTRRGRWTGHLVSVAAAALVATMVPAAAQPAAEDAVGMDLRLNALASPGYGHEGHDMPVYLGYSNNIRFEGTEETRQLEEPLVSNTISVPRAEWSPGEGAGEFTKALGIIAGPIIPRTHDEFADSYYFWSGMPEGASATGGDDLGHLKVWSGIIDPYQVPHTPTGREGTFAWRHDPSWPNVLRGTTTSSSGAVLPDGTTVTAPPTSFTRAMYLDHGLLEVEGGDLDAADGDVAAPTFEFAQETPPGTVMNLQSVGYSRGDGPWGDFVDVTPDFATGQATGPTGQWRLPVDVTLEEGGFWPERSQPADVAAPQYALAMRTVGIPLLPEEAGPGANDISLVADIAPGQTYVEHLALRQPDGSIETTRLVLDEPGRHVWRVEDGRLMEEESPDGPGYDAPGLVDEPVTGDAGTAPAALEEGEALPDGSRIEVNEAGRPVVRDVVRDGVRLADLVDVPVVHTAEGPVELGEHNRDGRAVIWEKPAGDLGRARAAYRVGDLLVITAVFYSTSGGVEAAVLSHSLSGEPIPHQVDTVATLGEATPVDLLRGEITRATRFLPSVLTQRLVLPTPEQQFRLEPQSWDDAEVEIRNSGTPPAGEPLTDAEYLARADRPEVWGRSSKTLQMAAEPIAPPSSGAFTAVRTYRLTPVITDRPIQVGGDPLEETRDFDGYEEIAVAFRAERPDGSVIRQDDVTRLFLDLRTRDGRSLLSRTFTGAPFTPDDGTTWGVALSPNGDLDPADVVVHARATYDGGVVTPEASAEVPAADWGFRIDRIPVSVTSTRDGVVEGVTEAHAMVSADVPEAAVRAETTADADGTFTVGLDLSEVPGGDYEVVVRAVEPAPAGGKDIVASAPLRRPSPASGVIPEDDTGTATARLRHLPGGSDPSLHRSGPPADRDAAVAFLASREDNGAYDGSLRATAWAVDALRTHGAPGAEASTAYLDSLAGDDGYAWHAGGAPSAAATGIAARAAAALGEPVAVDPTAFLRWDGSADAAPGADVSSVEATALLVVALEAAGELPALDPWWLDKIVEFLGEADPSSPAEVYATARAHRALGTPSSPIPGDDLDAVAYRALIGQDPAGDLSAYQLLTGGFTLRVDGDLPEAFPTALALAALGSDEG